MESKALYSNLSLHLHTQPQTAGKMHRAMGGRQAGPIERLGMKTLDSVRLFFVTRMVLMTALHSESQFV